MKWISGLLKFLLKLILCLGVFVVAYIVTTDWPKMFLTPDALIIYKYHVNNSSGEPVTCAVIGWFPRQSENAQIWQAAPNKRGPAHGLSLKNGDSVEIALSTSDFCGVQLLVQGNNATETRVMQPVKGFEFDIPLLNTLPSAPKSLIPCFYGTEVSLPAN